MTRRRVLEGVLIATVAALFFGARLIPGASTEPGIVSSAAAAIISSEPVLATAPESVDDKRTVLAATRTALAALSNSVRTMSHPEALESAFRSYFAYKAEHPGQVRKPYLYFVDFGLPNSAKRGYVFDMEAMEVVEGPFTVAHGHGSGNDGRGVPTRFSNKPGSAATSLGLYRAQETYSFNGKSGGRRYSSVGLRLAGVSGDYNDNARARGIVVHGAPYVSRAVAGRSEGCPAMEQARAQRLLPKLANGGMVFHFAPDSRWLAGDPWLAETNA